MAIWIAKAAVQKIISLLPFPHRINYFFQRHITRGARLTDDLFHSKLEHCSQHLTALREHTQFSENFTALELGTGWYPIIPVGLFLSGAGKIYSADIKSTISDENIRLTLRKFIDSYDDRTLQKFLPQIDEHRMQILKDLASGKSDRKNFFSALNIQLLVGDIAKQQISPGSIHLINSNNTFEHIPQNILKNILDAFRNFIHPKGVMSNFIDLSDHFSHLDSSITNYNFLKFSDLSWRIIDNSIQPQNRLRITHYRRLLQDTQWEILSEQFWRAQEDKLAGLKLAEKYAGIPASELSVTHALIISRPVNN